MSNSPRNDQRIALVAPAGSPTARVFVYDSDYRVVALGVGTLRTSLPPGIYKIRYEAGSTFAEDLFELSSGMSIKELPEPKMPGLRTPAPLADAFESSPSVGQRALELSNAAGIMCGSGSQLFVFVRGRAHGLGLYDFSDRLLTDFESVPMVEGCVGCNIDLDPGSYLLRCELEDGSAVEQTVFLSSGWQTQVFMSAETLSSKDVEPRPNLANSALFMAESASSISGCAARKALMILGRTPKVAVPTNAIRRRPATPCPIRITSRSVWSTRSRISLARSSSNSPAWVSRIWLRLRSNRAAPISLSNWAICRLNGG